MPDEPTTASPVGDPPAGPATTADDVSQLPEWAQKAIADTRKEAAKYRTRANELEPLAQKAQQLEDEKRTDAEKANHRAEQAEQRAQAALTRVASAELRALATADFANPEDASKFLDITRFIGKDGAFDNETAAADLKQLLTDRPYLGKQQGPRAPVYQPGQGSAGDAVHSANALMNASIRQAAGRA